MHSLKDIPGIHDTSLELLEAAGFHHCASLAQAGVDPLDRELKRANEILQITGDPPPREEIDRWIRAARKITGEENTEPATEAVMPVNFEVLPNVATMLEKAPCAIPFPGRWLSESNITVSEIAPGILLNRYIGDLEVRIEDRLPASHGVPKPAVNQYVLVAEKTAPSRLEIDISKIRTTDQAAAFPRSRRRSSVVTEQPPKASVADALELIEQSRSAKTGETKSRPRSHIRGVLHNDPWSVRLGALITLLLVALIPIAVVIPPLLLLADRDPEVYRWVRPWWIIFPFFLPLLALFWIISGYRCSCRICRQKWFVPKKHRKNAKAHHVPLLGYILPLIFHLLIFQWFRCTHCGTPVRLKK